LARSVVLPTTSGATIGGDVIASEIRFDESRGRLLARLGADADMDTISSRVQACRFRYFDGRRWVDSFDSGSTGGLPVAIEIVAWFGRVEVAEEELMTAVAPNVASGRAPSGENPVLPDREPDLLRVIIVPDGPE
jgi:hypothetical protein